MPAGVKQARVIADPSGYKRGGLLLTPGALSSGGALGLDGQIYLVLDQGLASAPDYARNTARRLGMPTDPVMSCPVSATTLTPPSAPACSSAPPAYWR